MVYYGVVSKGCERCRQRKIKCDQRKPECLKCEKSDAKCPGYRNLDDVLFRDESERIIEKVRPIEQSKSMSQRQNLATYSRLPTIDSQTSKAKSLTSSQFPLGICLPIAQPVNELGANFFFSIYSVNEPPFVSDYHDWLTRSYFGDEPSQVLRIAIEAVGLAGISNVFHAPQIKFKSNELYCRALAAMKQALNDPIQVIADNTFMAVILLGVFETVNFETWDRYCYWATHIKAATTILQLRGQEQFTRERGGQLYIQMRSQVLSSCMQQHIAVPPALVQASYNFENSFIRKKWQQRNVASSGSISEISFRIVNFRAALENREVIDTEVIRKMALEIDNDLENWRAGVPASWRYATNDNLEAALETSFNRRNHLYPNIWVADAWNNWRTMRILVNQIVVQNEVRSSASENAQKSIAISAIQHLSTDICVSVSSFIGSPRLLSLIEPLYIVSLESLNNKRVRYFAIEQLLHISVSMGVRRASLLAETVLTNLNEPSSESHRA